MTLTIVVVEDSPVDAAATTKSLAEAERFVARIVPAEDMAGALAALGEPHDVVVLDLDLPDSAGMDTVRRALKATDAPIIVNSTLGQEVLVMEALRAGCADYVVKGGDEGQLPRAVWYAAHRRHKLDEMRAQTDSLRDVIHGFIHDRSEAMDSLGADVAMVTLNPGGDVVRATPEGARIVEAMGPADRRALERNARTTLERAGPTSGALPSGRLVFSSQHPRDAEQVVCMLVEPKEGAVTLVPTLAGHEARHHFRTPLTPILMDLAALKASEESSHVRRIKQNTERLQAYAEDYIDAVALREGTLPLHKEDVDVAPLLGDLFDVDDMPGKLTVHGDPIHIARLLRLIAKRGGAPQTATVEVGPAAVTIEIRTPDWKGPSAEQMVEPFGLDPGPGDPAGLGFYIGDQVVAQMGGRFDIETDDDLVFRLRLPRPE